MDIYFILWVVQIAWQIYYLLIGNDGTKQSFSPS